MNLSQGTKPTFWHSLSLLTCSWNLAASCRYCGELGSLSSAVYSWSVRVTLNSTICSTGSSGTVFVPSSWKRRGEAKKGTNKMIFFLHISVFYKVEGFPFTLVPKIAFRTISYKRQGFLATSVGLILLPLQTGFYYCDLRVAFDMHKWKW